MKTIKSYTSLEQSKVLGKILPIESADMYWWSSRRRYYIEAIDDGDFNEEVDIRAWSLAALLNYLREIDFFPQIEVEAHSVVMYINYYNEEEAKPLAPVHNIKVEADTFVDACYEMILKLHKDKML